MINFTFCVYKNNEIGNLGNANANENGNLQNGGNLRIQQTHNKTGSPNSNVGGPMPNPLGTDFRMNFGACISLDFGTEQAMTNRSEAGTTQAQPAPSTKSA